MALGAALAFGVLPGLVTQAADTPTVTCDTDPNIFSTGYSQSRRAVATNGAIEERWMVAAGSNSMGLSFGSNPFPPGPLSPTFPGITNYGNAYVGKVNNAWLTSPFNTAQWISNKYVSPSAGGQNQNSHWGNFYYAYTFRLDARVDAASFRLSMDYYADNTVRGVWVNSTLKAATTQSPYSGLGFQSGNGLSAVLDGFTPGTNSIIVQVGSTYDAEGFMAQVRSTALCASLTVAKSVSGPRVHAADQFTVSAKNGSNATVAAATTSGTATSASSVAHVAPGTYTITDTLAAGSQSKAEHYQGVLTCVNRTDTSKQVAVTGAYPTWRVTLPVGSPHDYVCTVTNSSKSFTVSKTVSPAPPTVVHPGQKVTYSVVVKNTGRTAFSGAGTDVASFTDDLSRVLDDATFNGDATGGAVINGTVLSWKGPLAVGASVTITYSVTIKSPITGDGVLVNTVTGGPACASQCTASTSTSVQSYTVEKSASAETALPGDVVRYTVTVTNTGSLAFTTSAPATFTDDLSRVLDDATYNDDATDGAGYQSPVLSWSGPLPVGGTVSISYSVTIHSPVRGDRSMVNTVVSAASGSNCFTGSTDPRCTATVAVHAGDVSWSKVDATANGNLLPGSAWTLTPTDGGAVIDVEDCATAPCAGEDHDALGGQFKLIGLRPGEYELVETKAPPGFLLSTDPIAVTVGADGLAALPPVVNQQQTVPSLPFTGGIGADTYTIAGAGLLLATALVGGMRSVCLLVRRRRRAG